MFVTRVSWPWGSVGKDQTRADLQARAQPNICHSDQECQRSSTAAARARSMPRPSRPAAWRASQPCIVQKNLSEAHLYLFLSFSPCFFLLNLLNNNQALFLTKSAIL